MQVLDSFNLNNCELNQQRRIDIAEGVDDGHLNFIAQQWKPILVRQYKLAALSFLLLSLNERTDSNWKNLLEKRGAPDKHWEWHQKAEGMNDNEEQAYIMLDGGSVEAIMIICNQKESRFQDQTQMNTTYVKYLSVAPWNRKEINQPRRYNGLGSMLLATAISVSIGQGYGGKCGLHAISSAETFYLNAGMTDFGADIDEEGMKYFEFSTDAANRFIGENNDNS